MLEAKSKTKMIDRMTLGLSSPMRQRMLLLRSSMGLECRG